MAIDYATLRTKAETLIADAGRSVTFIKKDQGNPADPSKPWRASTGAADVSFPVIAAVVDYDFDEVDDTLVNRGDKRVLVSAAAVDTAAGGATNLEEFDNMVDGNDEYGIVNVGVVAPGDTRIIYDIQVRK